LKICTNCHPDFPRNYPPLGQVAGNVFLKDFIKEKQFMEKGISFLLNKKLAASQSGTIFHSFSNK